MSTVTDETLLAALDKPRQVYSVQQLVDPMARTTDAVQNHLMRLRTAGKVTFDIKTGRWRRVK